MKLQFHVPYSIHSQLKQLASQEGVSLHQLLVVAASNEVVRNETREGFVRRRALTMLMILPMRSVK